MKTMVPLLGWVLFLYCGFDFARGYGTQWALGRYGMPKSLVAADGFSYLDGTPVPPLILGLVRSGVEEEVMLGMLSVLGGLLLYLGLEIRKLHRSLLQYERQLGQNSADP